MRKPGAETDSIVPQSDETYADEHEKAEDICCESESDGLTCEHFWHHHHGNHGHSQHSKNHGCPDGETKNLTARDTIITAEESEEAEDHQCCERITTCEHFWRHHHGHEHSEHSGNYGCPPGKVQLQDDNGILEGDTSIAGDMSEEEEERACCEDAR